MRQHENQNREHQAQAVPHVLDYEVELLVDGRKLERPVNYGLVRIIPPKGLEIDPTRRPFMVVDPRAGHCPDIGGFKADSEIGVAMNAGHTLIHWGRINLRAVLGRVSARGRDVVTTALDVLITARVLR
jgi:Protein of unknown function (DUF3141)